MRRSRDVVLGLAIAAVLATASFFAGFRLGGRDGGSPFDEVVTAADRLQSASARPVSEEELARAAIRGMLESLGDPYARLLEEDQRRTLRNLLSGTVVGIGVWLDGSEDGLVVTSVVAGTPAEEAGLRAGDVIVSVDGHDVSAVSVDQATAYFTGPVDSVASLTVLRDEAPMEFDVRREEIELRDVTSRMLSADIGYVQLFQFGKGATEQLREAVQGLLDRGARGIVLDLRDNAGGLAEEAYDVTGLFLDGGVVARIREPGRPEQLVYADGEPLADFPMAVLVDGGTASAAEILAGALQDRGRALLVGLRTYGKGSVLSIQDLDDPGGNAIQFTSAYFFTPDGDPVEGRGIVPDVTVFPKGPGDPQLDRGMAEIRAQLVS